MRSFSTYSILSRLVTFRILLVSFHVNNLCLVSDSNMFKVLKTIKGEFIKSKLESFIFDEMYNSFEKRHKENILMTK